jgi:hypothetical protein
VKWLIQIFCAQNSTQKNVYVPEKIGDNILVPFFVPRPKSQKLEVQKSIKL